MPFDNCHFKRISTDSLQQTNLYAAFYYYVKKQPISTALVCNEQKISYAELHYEAEHLANVLLQNGVNANSFIPIALDRSKELVISILATLRAGVGYALIDPCWPNDRIKKVLKALSPPLAIAEKNLTSFSGIKCISPHDRSYIKTIEAQNKRHLLSSTACIFFTSGTTGEPKGVISTQQGTLRLFKSPTFACFDNQTVVSIASATPWDAFSLELWGALANGGTGLIIDEPYLSAPMLRQGVKKFGLNTIWMTSSLFNMTLEEDLESFSGLNFVMIGGEKLSQDHVKIFLKRHPNIKLINGYGPVETTVFATTHQIKLSDCNLSSGIPLGQAVPETQVFVLDDNLAMCEDKHEGQICIAGQGLAEGYLNDAELTDEKFKNLNVSGEQTRVYCTGDRGYFDNGVLYFRGRQDRQIKIRGHRVELAEVEVQIKDILPNMNSCRVVSRPDKKNKSQDLIAFCISSNKIPDPKSSLNKLKSSMVSYQCPSIIHFIESFPLTSQGKLDENALFKILEPQLVAKNSRNLDVKPTTHTEELICNTISDFVPQNHIPSDISFTDLGLSSLDMGRICTRISKKLGQHIPLSEFYNHPTLSELCKFIDDIVIDSKGSKYTYYPSEMNPMQLMYLTQNLANPTNLSSRCLLTWSLEGELDLDRLQNAIQKCHYEHLALCSFYVPDVDNVDITNPSSPPPLVLLEALETKDMAIQSLRSELSKELDPIQGKLWRTALAPIARTNSYIFACAIHHIAFDGYSEHLLANSISKFYNHNQYILNTKKSITSDNLSYLLHPPTHCSKFKESAEILAKSLECVAEVMWPNEESISSSTTIEISLVTPRSLLKKAQSSSILNRATDFEILLFSWILSLSDIINQKDFCIGIPVRLLSNFDSSEEVNCNINMISPHFTASELQKSVDGFTNMRHLIKTGLSRMDIPFTEILQEIGPKQTGRPPLFQTLFAFQDNPPPQLDLSGFKTDFIRQPYLDLPLELHAEFWPLESGDLKLIISFKPDRVTKQTAQKLLKAFSQNLESVLSYL